MALTGTRDSGVPATLGIGMSRACRNGLRRFVLRATGERPGCGRDRQLPAGADLRNARPKLRRQGHVRLPGALHRLAWVRDLKKFTNNLLHYVIAHNVILTFC